MGVNENATVLRTLAGLRRHKVVKQFLKAFAPHERDAVVARFEAASDAAPKGVFLCILCLLPARWLNAPPPPPVCTCPPIAAVENPVAYYRNQMKARGL
jgi:hypothetical protein